MIFLFNQTGEVLKLKFSITEQEDSTADMDMSVVFPNQGFIKVLHTSTPSIIKAAKTRFPHRIIDLQPERLIGCDFYISKKRTGFDLRESNVEQMGEMIPCNMNPSIDRDITRNLAIAIFKCEEGKTPSIRTFDGNDSTATYMYRVDFYDNGNPVTYEVHLVAIKWVGWYRLKRPAYLVVDNGTDTKFFQFSCVESKLKENIQNDFLKALTPEETKQILESEKEKATRANRIPNEDRQRRPQNNNRGRRPNNNNYQNNNYRKKPNFNNDGRKRQGSGQQGGNRNRPSGNNRQGGGYNNNYNRNNSNYKKKKNY